MLETQSIIILGMIGGVLFLNFNPFVKSKELVKRNKLGQFTKDGEELMTYTQWRRKLGLEG